MNKEEELLYVFGLVKEELVERARASIRAYEEREGHPPSEHHQVINTKYGLSFVNFDPALCRHTYIRPPGGPNVQIQQEP